MTRCILINDCNKCPHISHGGGFGSPAYIPVCSYLAHRELGHSVHANARGTGTTAVYDGVIPDWCPLPVVPDEAA